MFESVIYLLIQLCFVVLLAYIILWVLGQLGIALPERVVQIFWVIVVLIVLLLLYRMFSPILHGGRLSGLLDHISMLT